MFFFRYLRHELRARMRQAVVIALGLALGVGLVVTVIAASDGVSNAQSGVLKGLYGVGTDVTVTKPPPPFNPASGTRIQVGQNGGQVCNDGKCSSSGAQTIDNLTSGEYGPIGYSSVASVARLHDVTAAAGGLTLTDNQISIPASLFSGGGAGGLPTPKSFTVTGVDFGHPDLGPLSNATLASGREFRSSDANADVAVVDTDYAASNNLKTGSTITIAKTKFTVIGTVTQPAAASPPDVYIPLARAQALATSNGKTLKNDVNTIYVTAASAADVTTVQREVSHLLPSATVNTPSSLASQVTGSVSSTAHLADDLGRWLSVLVLIAAFAIAALLTIAAVSRRVREFGTLKALGWRSGRIMSQVLGESVAVGVLGAALGTALGFAGVAIIDAIAPKLSGTLTTSTGQHFQSFGPSGSGSSSPTVAHTVSVPMSAVVSGGAITLAVVLAIVGGLLAGTAGSWQIARLRPADALARVA